MRSLSFGFRDYAVHLFPGCLVVSSLLYLFFDFAWVTPSLAPLLLLLFLIGGYVVGFFMETITVVLLPKSVNWVVSGGDPLKDYFKDVRLSGDPHDIKDSAAQLLVRDFGDTFVRNQKFKELLYLMMRDVEAANERSAAFVSRVNALENMAKNMGISCLWVMIVLFVNGGHNTDQMQVSLLSGLGFGAMGLLLLHRRTRYRTWLAKSVLRAFVSLERQSAAQAAAKAEK